MDTRALDEILETFNATIETELEAEGLAAWTINISGSNFLDNFSTLSLSDLKELRSEIKEGAPVAVIVDLSQHLLDSLDEMISTQEDDSDDEEDDEDMDTDDDSYEDE